MIGEINRALGDVLVGLGYDIMFEENKVIGVMKDRPEHKLVVNNGMFVDNTLHGRIDVTAKIDKHYHPVIDVSEYNNVPNFDRSVVVDSVVPKIKNADRVLRKCSISTAEGAISLSELINGKMGYKWVPVGVSGNLKNYYYRPCVVAYNYNNYGCIALLKLDKCFKAVCFNNIGRHQTLDTIGLKEFLSFMGIAGKSESKQVSEDLMNEIVAKMV